MNKLAIVGSHPATRLKAPFDNLDYDIWAFNEAVEVYRFPRWTACMQMHRPQNYTAASNWVDDFQQRNTHHWAWLQTDHGPDKVIWMQQADPRVPNSRRYPLDEIFSQPWAKRQWITSTASYALALAIYLGYKTIDVYGIELSSNTEYYAQLHNWQYWVGVADGLGVTVTLYSGEMHFADRLYGYEGETQIEQPYFLERADLHDKAWHQAEFVITKVRRNLDDAILARNYQEVQTQIINLREACITSGQSAGAFGEADRYSKRPDPISRQEFELRIARASNDGEGHRATTYHLGGKIEYVFNVWKQHGNIEALNQMRQFIGDLARASYDFGAHLGIGNENELYIHQYDDRLKAAGGERAIMALQGA